MHKQGAVCSTRTKRSLKRCKNQKAEFHTRRSILHNGLGASFLAAAINPEPRLSECQLPPLTYCGLAAAANDNSPPLGSRNANSPQLPFISTSRCRGASCRRSHSRMARHFHHWVDQYLPSRFFYGCRPERKLSFPSLASDQVRSSIRPLYAAFEKPLAGMVICRAGPNLSVELMRS